MLLVTTAAAHAASAYDRALALRETDPVEAEALLDRFIRSGPTDKRARAARHELFYLRLKNNRLVEAYPQARTKSFGKKYREAVTLRYNLRPKAVARLLGMLAEGCEEKNAGEGLQMFLNDQKAGAAVYEYAIRVLENCKVEDAANLLPSEKLNEPAGDERELALKLLVARYAISDNIRAGQIAEVVAAVDAPVLQKSRLLSAQLALIRARLAVAAGDLERAKEHCKTISGPGLKPVKDACRFLIAVGLANQSDFAEGYKLVAALEIPPAHIDHRLVRVCLGVAAGKISREKLEKFVRRASYRYSAPVLRELTDKVLSQQD